MYTRRNLQFTAVIRFTWQQLLAYGLWATVIVVLYQFAGLDWLRIPWVPITLIGIAVAFYMGFKNNSAYDRTWEARKIWGAIVNSSRSWGIMARDFVTDEFADRSISEEELTPIRRRLMYRHIAWLYRLKRQLRGIKDWEHNRDFNNNFRKRVKEIFPWDAPEEELLKFLPEEEVKEILSYKNPATQLIAHQSADLRQLRKENLIDDFRHISMNDMLVDFYTQQGKCERIKNFPLPRQYASTSIYLFYIFLFLLPMGLLSAFDAGSVHLIWGIIPFTMLIGWIFWMMEIVGDYAENPFENLMFDIPMDSLTRTIEIDMREMLKEKDLPAPIKPQNNFVM